MSEKFEIEFVDAKSPITERLSFLEDCAETENLTAISEMIFDAPHDFLCMPPRMARGLVIENLRALGWTWEKIWEGLREIKALLSSNNVKKYNSRETQNNL